MFRTDNESRGSVSLVLGTIILITLLSMCLSPHLHAQDCEAALEDALESLIEQDYNRIIMLLTDCPPDRLLEPSQKIMAYKLLAQAYFVTDQKDSSRDAMHSLLDLEPDFDPQPPQYSEQFIGLLEEVRDSRMVVEDKKRGLFRSKWFWIGGAAVTATTVYLIVGGKKETPATRLPDPPSFPGNE
jgi:hypothetical protein